MKSGRRFSRETRTAVVKSFLEMRRTAREMSSDMLKLEILGYIAAARLDGDVGTNAHSISEITGIPGETVRRKVKELISEGAVVRSGPRSIHISQKTFDDYLRILDKLAEIMFKLVHQSETKSREGS